MPWEYSIMAAKKGTVSKITEGTDCGSVCTERKKRNNTGGNIQET